VTEEQRDRAIVLYNEGNQLFDNAYFKEAAVRYRKALEQWDHPSIHYNLMLAYVSLERPLDAYKSSVEALRHGQRALQPDEYRRAKDFHKLLQGRIAELEIVCDEPGAMVSLDGKTLFTAPGRTRTLVLPGSHAVVASKDGYLATHAPLLLVPGKITSVELDMLHADQALLSERRWASWKPWALVGAGATLGVAGGLLQWRASEANQRYMILFGDECKVPEGCSEPDDYSGKLRSLERRSTWYWRFSRGSYIAGGATIITGLALAYFNLPRSVNNPARNNLVHISVTPHVAPSYGGLTMDMSF
jgi:tetratricopeptide (TPR) repeat protein